MSLRPPGKRRGLTAARPARPGQPMNPTPRRSPGSPATTSYRAARTGPPSPPTAGNPTVVESAMRLRKGALVHLDGIPGERGAPAKELTRYIDGRELPCAPADRAAPKFRCKIGDYDLGEAILL